MSKLHYIVHVTAAAPEDAGAIMQAAVDRGYKDIRFSAIDAGKRRAVRKDELERILRSALESDEAALPELWGPKEILNEYDIAKSTLARWRERDDFPAPEQELHMGPLWRADVIREWAATRVDRRTRE